MNAPEFCSCAVDNNRGESSKYTHDNAVQFSEVSFKYADEYLLALNQGTPGVAFGIQIHATRPPVARRTSMPRGGRRIHAGQERRGMKLLFNDLTHIVRIIIRSR